VKHAEAEEHRHIVDRVELIFGQKSLQKRLGLIFLQTTMLMQQQLQQQKKLDQVHQLVVIVF
jgi:hypothetical protein